MALPDAGTAPCVSYGIKVLVTVVTSVTCLSYLLGVWTETRATENQDLEATLHISHSPCDMEQDTIVTQSHG